MFESNSVDKYGGFSSVHMHFSGRIEFQFLFVFNHYFCETISIFANICFNDEKEGCP